MQEFLEELENLQNWKLLLREACKKNKIYTSTAEQLTPKKLKTLNEWFNKVHKVKQLFDSWTQHEKGAFKWVLIALSAIKNVLISDFGGQEWEKLFKIFSNKSENFLRYETRRFLVEKTCKNKQWQRQEEKILTQLISEHATQNSQQHSKWYSIARKLFQKSEERYFRSAKQCRERWSNYLDPSKERGQWSVNEELRLLQHVEQKGKKWSEVAKQLKRNQHCVKNKYNSIVTHQKKINPTLRKQQKILSEAIKRLQKQIIPQVKRQASPQKVAQADIAPVKEMLLFNNESKMRIKFKNSSQSLFDDNRSFVNYNTQLQNRNRLDFPFYVEGEEFVKHLMKEDEEPQKAQNYNQNYVWSISSPQIMTPFGLSPSPITLNFAMGQLNNFNRFMQNWGKPQQTQQFK